MRHEVRDVAEVACIPAGGERIKAAFVCRLGLYPLMCADGCACMHDHVQSEGQRIHPAGRRSGRPRCRLEGRVRALYPSSFLRDTRTKMVSALATGAG